MSTYGQSKRRERTSLLRQPALSAPILRICKRVRSEEFKSDSNYASSVCPVCDVSALDFVESSSQTNTSQSSPNGIRRFNEKTMSRLSKIIIFFLLGRNHDTTLAFMPPKVFTSNHKSTSLSSLSSSSSSKTTSTTTLQQLVSGGPLPADATVAGEADRAFRQGIQLEKSGQSRAANSAFHEAATLYQCFLEEEGAFGHVTTLPSGDDVKILLSYNLDRLGFLNLDALSDPRAAIRLYQLAISMDPFPSAVSYKGLGTALEATGGNGKDMKHLEEAANAYQEALNTNQASSSTKFAMGVVLERLGSNEQADEIMTSLQRQEAPISCLVDSWGYVRWHTRKTPPEELNLNRGTRDIIKLALDAAMPLIEQQQKGNRNHGMVCEFGVGSGRSIRMTQEILPLDIHVHGFDTFTGLPHAWGDEPKGAYSTGGVVPNVEGNVHFHKGLFGDTIGPFLEELNDDTAFLAYANIDCDLYTSTLDILEAMHGRIVQGTILVFDEYICHPTWRQDEFRAWRECCKRFGWKYEYLAFSMSTKQAVVRITEAA